MQARTIALGGFAVERRLWEEGRLLLPDGSIPTEKQMLNESANNADVDRVAFFGGDYREQDGTWPRDKDLQFMQAAQKLGQMIDMSFVERLAGALLTEGFVDESRIKEI